VPWNRVLLAAAVALLGVAPAPAAASAETAEAATTCANPFTGAQPGPSSFTFTVPSTIHVGDSVAIQLSFAIANTSGFPITDLNTFAMPAAAPVALTAGSQGAVADGGSATVTLTGTWSPSAAGTQTVAASDWTFNTVAFGLTIPVTCTFTSTPPSVTRTVTPPPTLAVRPAKAEAGRPVRLSGANWAPSSSGTVSLCTDATGATGCTTIGRVTSTAAGRLCGRVLIPRGAKAGTYGIKVTVGPDTKVAPIALTKARRPGHGGHPGSRVS